VRAGRQAAGAGGRGGGDAASGECAQRQRPRYHEWKILQCAVAGAGSEGRWQVSPPPPECPPAERAVAGRQAESERGARWCRQVLLQWWLVQSVAGAGRPSPSPSSWVAPAAAFHAASLSRCPRRHADFFRPALLVGIVECQVRHVMGPHVQVEWRRMPWKVCAELARQRVVQVCGPIPRPDPEGARYVCQMRERAD